MSQKRILPFEIILPLLVIPLLTISVFFIYSANMNSSGVLISNEHIKQTLWAILGVITMVVLSIFDIEKIKQYSIYFYVLSIVLVIATFLTSPINGARSWLKFGPVSLQPSEFCKVATIFFLAYFIEKTDDIRHIKNFLICILIVAVPGALVLVQPDLGSATVFLSIFLFALFFGGTKVRYIVYSLLTFILTILLTALPFIEEKMSEHKTFIYDMVKNDTIHYFILSILFVVFLMSLIGQLVFKKFYFYWIMYAAFILLSAFVVSMVFRKMLKEYQIMRLVIFINPYFDQLNYGWNIIQSLTAVGSGGFTGKGYLQGTQSHYQFLPKQSSDFIFSVISEESGFIGSVAVICLFLLILIRLMYISYNANSLFGTSFIAGFMGMIFFHFFINVGMTMSVTPITGIPLLFVSYGGSSLWSSCIAMGICMSINNSRA